MTIDKYDDKENILQYLEENNIVNFRRQPCQFQAMVHKEVRTAVNGDICLIAENSQKTQGSPKNDCRRECIVCNHTHAAHV